MKFLEETPICFWYLTIRWSYEYSYTRRYCSLCKHYGTKLACLYWQGYSPNRSVFILGYFKYELLYCVLCGKMWIFLKQYWFLHLLWELSEWVLLKKLGKGNKRYWERWKEITNKAKKRWKDILHSMENLPTHSHSDVTGEN